MAGMANSVASMVPSSSAGKMSPGWQKLRLGTQLL